MAIATLADFQIYQDQFFAGMNEIIQQETEVFNERSNNAIRLVSRAHRGHYVQESFFEQITNLVTRRDVTSTSTATDLPLTQGELTRVKVNRKIGPASVTEDAFYKIDRDPQEISFVLGTQAAKAVQQDYCNMAVASGVAAIRNIAALVMDHATGAGTATMNHVRLTQGLAKFGDAQNRIIAWVMHSKVFFDLMQNSITDNVFNVAGPTVIQGTIASLGRPVIIVDAPGLTEVSASSDTTYLTLGLTANGIVVEQSEEQRIVNQLITGSENLFQRIQGEHAFTLGVKGFSWDTTNGGNNPTAAALGTSQNWDFAMADNKSAAGIVIITD